jgi:hypothetical protein
MLIQNIPYIKQPRLNGAQRKGARILSKNINIYIFKKKRRKEVKNLRIYL